MRILSLSHALLHRFIFQARRRQLIHFRDELVVYGLDEENGEGGDGGEEEGCCEVQLEGEGRSVFCS